MKKPIDEYYRDAEKMASGLGISRQTLFRWDKIHPLPRSRWRMAYGKPRIEGMHKSELLKWYDELRRKNRDNDELRYVKRVDRAV